MPGTGSSGGRNAIPTAIKKLRGNPGHRPVNNSEPTPDPGVPDAPAGLSKLAKKEWREVIPKLEQLGVLSRVDGFVLAEYCHTRSQWKLACKDVARRGQLIEEAVYNRKGDVVGKKTKRNPSVTIMTDCQKLMRAYECELGLNPGARARLSIEKPAEQPDPVEEFLRRKSLHSIVATS